MTRIYLYLALALVLLGAGGYGVWSYRHMAAQADKVPELEAKVNTLAQGYQTLSNETIRRSEFDAALRATRAAVSHNLDNITREDPVARDYLGERIPDSVRGAYQPPTQR
jgi:hypothetical protein